jgi:hypothetical protein
MIGECSDYNEGDSQHSSRSTLIQVESSKVLPIIVVLALLSGLAIALAALAFAQANRSERETRMLEYYVMELDGKAMQHGIIRTDESWSATKEKRK